MVPDTWSIINDQVCKLIVVLHTVVCVAYKQGPMVKADAEAAATHALTRLIKAKMTHHFRQRPLCNLQQFLAANASDPWRRCLSCSPM